MQTATRSHILVDRGILPVAYHTKYIGIHNFFCTNIWRPFVEDLRTFLIQVA
jgi:hypothetical protein